MDSPEDYRWNSIGYHIQTGNKDNFLSLEYRPGEIRSAVTSELHGAGLKEFNYFTDSGVIGSKEFVSKTYIRFKHYFNSKNEKKPKLVKGLSEVYSLKQLSEVV